MTPYFNETFVVLVAPTIKVRLNGSGITLFYTIGYYTNKYKMIKDSL